MLLGGDKAGDWRGWYGKNVRVADERFTGWLKSMRNEEVAYMLAEVRKRQQVTQVEMARRLGVGQPRISQIERGELDRAGLSTLRGYVEALGGELEVCATFGEERLRIA